MDRDDMEQIVLPIIGQGNVERLLRLDQRHHQARRVRPGMRIFFDDFPFQNDLESLLQSNPPFDGAEESVAPPFRSIILGRGADFRKVEFHEATVTRRSWS